MRQYLPAALFAASAFISGFMGCSSNPDGTGGSGGSGTGGSGGSGTTTTTTTTTTTVTSTSSGMVDCAGLGANYGEVCGACLEAKCCQELFDGGGELTQELNDCGVSVCADECVPPAPAEVGEPECSLPAELPTEGACVTITDLITCNPVTNEPCDTAGGAACDANSNGGFSCFGPPNDTDVCGACDSGNGPWCKPGSTCVGAAGTKCARYCCSDADCGSGTCFKDDGAGLLVFSSAPDMGVCVDGGGGGSGGSGGTGGTGGTGGSMTGSGGAGGSMTGSGGTGGAMTATGSGGAP